jgi:hypothetical protein
MFENIRQAIIALTARAQDAERSIAARKARGLAISLFRKPAEVAGKLASFAEFMGKHAEETASWVTLEKFDKGERGAFDACDLPIWLALAEKCGVDAVPAREILRLTEDEMSFLSGKAHIPEDRVTKGLRRRAAAFLKSAGQDASGPPASGDIDPYSLQERLFAVMDDVPDGWMVRSARCGSIELKSLAGAGLAGSTTPEIRFGNDLEIGPGWIRNGNRRRVNVSDTRTVTSHAEGPGGDAVFLARPWMEAARYFVGPDPHRHGTPFAGKGMWPAEWRAFVEGGRVVGVSSYYGWCGEITPENARVALEVRELAQRIADAATEAAMFPRYMDVEFARMNKNPAFLENEIIQNALVTFGRETVSCTLDFIETKDRGLLLLEGGPANTPFGGGHPCSFSGCGGKPRLGNRTSVDGVAFKLMPHVILADPGTWDDGDRSGCILSWEEVQALVADNSPGMGPG